MTIVIDTDKIIGLNVNTRQSLYIDECVCVWATQLLRSHLPGLLAPALLLLRDCKQNDAI